ncbi:hypothetical protein HDU82_000964 [Entophlyctis luteolus]|nr:hypothetical protein HDU82_000964 [Entophlyctis luteolus]
MDSKSWNVLPGDTAIITGAASGIGLALATRCHSLGMNVILVDLDESGLAAAKSIVGERSAVFAMDVGKTDDWARLKDSVANGRSWFASIDRGTLFYFPTGNVTFLAVNAGISPRGTFEEPEYFQRMFSTNFFGVVNGVATFLPLLKANTTRNVRVVITGSKQGITNPPGNPAYNASKAAVRSFAEGLSHELRNTHVAVHLLVPGWTYTGLSGAEPGSIKGKPSGAWTPDQVVDYLMEGISRGKFYIVCPDNEVTEELDKKRMLWSIGDIVYDRPPLTRWREDTKDAAAQGVRDVTF